MGLQYIITPGSGLYLGSIFFMHGMMIKRANIMNDVFSKYFIDPTDRNNWVDIMSVFEPHIYQNLSPSGATPSKPPRQIDGGFQPIIASKLGSDYAQMYDQAKNLNLLLDSDAMAYHFDETIDPTQNIEGSMRWEMLMNAYIVLKNMEDVTGLIFEAIKPLYRSTATQNKTPAQLWFHIDEYMHGTLSIADGINFIPWSTIDQFKTDNPSDLGIIDVILGYHFTELWYITLPGISIGGGSDVHHVDASGFSTLSPPSGLPYGVVSTFVPDPVADPLTETPSLFTFYNEYFNANVIKYTILLNDGTGGTITTTYHTLTVT